MMPDVPFLATFPLRIGSESVPQKRLLGHGHVQKDAGNFLHLFAKDFCDMQCHARSVTKKTFFDHPIMFY